MNIQEIKDLSKEIMDIRNKLIDIKEDKYFICLKDKFDNMLSLSESINFELEAIINKYIDQQDYENCFNLDYFSKYYFYEEEEFKNKKEDGEYILEQVKLNGRYEIDGHSFTYSKYNNVVESETKTNVEVNIIKDSENIAINGEEKHLDLNYKFDKKRLEDHIRIATRIIENSHSVSCLLYINHQQADSFLNTLEYIKNIQERNISRRNTHIMK
ncbi:hypothetical protein [[Clostridium] dakarense]|uniref:hypothetical protein n=1 Tax=Faecalimicrobium dakarense TaxID=1301100 RepID=UPI0004BA17A8|nr:hypothetical protein [[Clostridium] dakarense]